MREVRLVTLVFENLDVDGKRFFRQAVKDILDMSPEPNLYFSVLTVDHKLQCIQPFTADHAALLKSLDKSSMWSFIQLTNQSAQVKAELKQTLSGGEPQLQSSATGGPSQGQIQSASISKWRRCSMTCFRRPIAQDREYNVHATMDALSALVRAQSQLPGRKVVLYFNPWLIVSDAVKEQYQNLISIANRANVSFYTVDPKGLVTRVKAARAARN